MNYDPLKKVIQLTPAEAEGAALYLLCAIRNVKKAAGLPLAPYKHDKALEYADHAMKNILDGAERLGIDLGARWGNELDSTQHT